MKKILSISAILLGTMLTFAQVPEKMSYQAIIRNASGQLLQNQNVAVKVSVLQNSATGTVVYSERLTGTTNTNGLLSMEIGTGTVLSGTFNSINWSSGNYYLKTETDPTGGTNYTIAGTSQLLSVPYAMYAKTSGSGGSGLTLPYAGTSSANNVIPFRITNSSATLNQAGFFENTSSANTAPALMGTNNSTGGFGVGVMGRANSNTNGNVSMGVSGQILGTGTAGAGVYGSAENATAVYGITNNGYGIYGYTYGTGTAGVFQAESTGKALQTIGALQFTGNGAAAGKVLTASDASGNATWQNLPATSSVWTTSGNNIYNANTGNVGIGTPTPDKGKLDVRTVSENTPAIYGYSQNSAAAKEGGVFGTYATDNAFGVGVQGIGYTGVKYANASTSFSGAVGAISDAGVYGSANNYGVLGTSENGWGIAGISKKSDGVAAGGVAGVGNYTGVAGYAQNIGNATVPAERTGVYGSATGASSGNYGVRASATGTGLVANYGVRSSATGASNTNYGIFGIADGATSYNYSIYGYAPSSNASVVVNAAIYGTTGGNNAANNYAGYFSGNVGVTGVLSKGSGTFKIDHPLDPANKYLYHSFVESPDMMNIYNGNTVTDASGTATVSLPAYFEALNMEFRYQLTVIGTFAQAIIKEKVHNNRFVIQTNQPNVEVSWQVTGIRHDKFAEAHRVVPEVEKEPQFKGKYLHAKEWGKPDSQSIGEVMKPKESKEMLKNRIEKTDKAQK